MDPLPYGVGMRWEALFQDMEAQLEADERAAVRAGVAELVRAERATVRTAARLRAAVGRQVRVQVMGADAVEGEVVDAAEQWVLLALGPSRRVLVPAAAIVAVAGVGRQAQPDGGVVERRLGLGHALRALARDRSPVGVRAGDVDLYGRLEAVGADHVDVMVPGPGRTGLVWTVPFAALVWVRTG